MDNLNDPTAPRQNRQGSSSTRDVSNKPTVVVAHPGQGSDVATEISYTDTKVIGNGSFGVVYQARLMDTNEQVAIKRVLQDKRFKNRELQIMKRLDHCNIVKLKYYFYTSGEKKEEVYLNLVLEYIPETVYRVARHYSRQKATIPISFIKLYMYQLFRSLAYIHSLGICHRDIKPQNLLLDPETGVLKLCDFGSAKHLVDGEPNVSYICSRYYRAPELIFGATDYTTMIDVWSAGCVLAELLLGQPIFPGDSGVDQLVEIIKVLGTPTRQQIHEMNHNYSEFRFPQIRAHPWTKVFRSRTPPESVDLVSKLLEYTPTARMTPLQACAHPFFNELREPGTKLPNNRELPPLFNFTPHELKIQPSLNDTLIPLHIREGNTPTSTPSAAGAGGNGGGTKSGSTDASSSTSNTLLGSSSSTAPDVIASAASASTASGNGNNSNLVISGANCSSNSGNGGNGQSGNDSTVVVSSTSGLVTSTSSGPSIDVSTGGNVTVGTGSSSSGGVIPDSSSTVTAAAASSSTA